jgi:serine/threonine-protein kinase
MSGLIGTTVGGKYELTKFLGEGGLGRVFAAVQAPFGRKVAVKLLHPELSCDASITSRFEREARAASLISHPNSVIIHDFGLDVCGPKRQLYLVMEYLSGETLHDRIQNHKQRRLPAQEAVRILSQVLRPLAAFHKAGVVHRDLKPDNIMLCQSDDGEHVKLLDFGIAKVSGVSLTATGQMIGTPHYMAPEQITASKELGPTVDIYAMGILLYEALTGDPPYLADHYIDLFRMHLRETPTPLSRVLPNTPHLWPFEAVIQKAMSKKPQDRYQTADELRVAMEAALAISLVQEAESIAQTDMAPPWPLEEKSTTEILLPEDYSEEQSIEEFRDADTISMPPLMLAVIEETIRMSALPDPAQQKPEQVNPIPAQESASLAAWVEALTTETGERSLVVRSHPTWVQRSRGFWRRVSRLWQLFRVQKS